MPPAKGFVIRIAIYSVALLYLAGDLFLFNGPVNRKIQASRSESPQAIAYAKSKGVVATVYGHPIYRSQVEYAVREGLWLEGGELSDLSDDERRLAYHRALEGLIDERLLRIKAQYNASDFPVGDAELESAMETFRARFSSRAEMRTVLARAGIESEEEMMLRLGARIQQEKYLEGKIAAGIEVTEKEARDWYESNLEAMVNPPRVRVRHIFLATLERESAVAREQLETARQKLAAGTADFESLANELSEDPRTREAGGDLGWMTSERVDEEFAGQVFALPVGKVTLVQTKLGWHLVEVTAKRSEEARSFDEARAEIVAALETVKREKYVRAWRRTLRKQEETSVRVFVDNFTTP